MGNANTPDLNNTDINPSGEWATVQDPETLLTIPLNKLPLQTPITKGTFTIGGKSIAITDLSENFSSLLIRINRHSFTNAIGGGVDPENDGPGVTLEYVPGTDKLLIDGGELSAGGNPGIPTLGSPTDTSNFLQVMRLLDREPDPPRLADFEPGTGIDLWEDLTDPGKLSWLAQNDPHYDPALIDDRIYVGKNGLMYRRKEVSNVSMYASQHNYYGWKNHNGNEYQVDDQVYAEGFIWKWKNAGSVSTFNDATAAHWVKDDKVYRVTGGHDDPDIPSESGGSEERGYWKLAVDLSAVHVDAGAGQNFQSALAAGNHSPLVAGGAYKKGDVVKAGTGEGYFRAVQDRTVAKIDDFKTVANFDSSETGFADLYDNLQDIPEIVVNDPVRVQGPAAFTGKTWKYNNSRRRYYRQA